MLTDSRRPAYLRVRTSSIDSRISSARRRSCSSTFANGDSGVLTASDVHVKDYPTVKAVEWLGQELSEETGGRFSIRQYPAGQLGRESEAINMARFGAIDLTRVYTSGLNNASH